MNIRVSKSNGGTAYVYGTMSNLATKAQMHHVMRNLYSEICEEYRCNDLTFQFDDYHVRIRSVKLQRERAEKVFQDIQGLHFDSNMDIAFWIEEHLGMALPGLEIGLEQDDDFWFGDTDDKNTIDEEDRDKEQDMFCTFGLYVVPGFYDARFVLKYVLGDNQYHILQAYWN